MRMVHRRICVGLLAALPLHPLHARRVGDEIRVDSVVPGVEDQNLRAGSVWLET